MSNPVSVKWFDSTMAGAPALSGTAGTLISVLDACLVNGFGSVTLDSLVVSGGVATATKSAGHGFLDHAVVLIAGATPSGLNGEKRITRVSSSVFTFDATGIANQTATGTITAKVAPVGWTKAYSGTNKAAYARSDPAATAMLLRVDDTGTTTATVSGYETMSDVDTGTGAFAGSGTSGYTNAYFCKSNAANATARPWYLYADGRMFYLFFDYNGNAGSSFFHSFGDFISYRSGDAYNCVLQSCHTAAANDNDQVNRTGTIGCCLCRSYSQIGGYVEAGRASHVATPTYMGQGQIPYESPVDNSFHAAPVELWESSTLPRGVQPGLWNPLHSAGSIPHGKIIDNLPQLPGRKLIVHRFESSCTAAFDITGPWR